MVDRNSEVWLHLSTYVSVSSSGSIEHVDVRDAYRPSGGWTSCLRPGHFPVYDRISHDRLDCACDAPCPRCRATVGRECTTLDGGGMSGGGYRCRTHAVRVKVSPWCQGLLDGSRHRCDIGDHDWRELADAVAQCARCARIEPLRVDRVPLFSTTHWTRT